MKSAKIVLYGYSTRWKDWKNIGSQTLSRRAYMGLRLLGFDYSLSDLALDMGRLVFSP